MHATPEDRQRARDRAADAIAPREMVVLGPKGWAPPLVNGPSVDPTERRRRDRARAKARQ